MGMKKIILLIKREFKRFTGNEIMMILLIGGPILYGILFGAVYSSGKITDQPIIVIDKDQSPLSATLIDMLEDNEGLTIKYVLTENTDIQKKFLEDGIQAAVFIPDFFETDIVQGRYSEVNTYINNANLVSSGYVNRSIFLVVSTLNSISSVKSGKPSSAIQLNVFRQFNPASNYMQFVWPSYLAVILQSVILVVIAMSFASETEHNTFRELEELKTNPITIALGKLVIYWVVACFALLVYACYFFLFRQRFPVHVTDTLIISGIFIVSVSFQGMIAGLLFKSQLKVIQFLMILIMPAYITSGFSWPSVYDSWPAQLYGLLFPYLPFVNGLRILLIERGSLADIQDYALLQIVQLVLYFLIALLILKFKLKRNSRGNLPVQVAV